MHFDLYFSKYFHIAHKKIVLKRGKLTNEQERKTIWPLKNLIHLVSFKRFEFVEEKNLSVINYQTFKETKHLCTHFVILRTC